jgi:signal transduction histidine kinase
VTKAETMTAAPVLLTRRQQLDRHRPYTGPDRRRSGRPRAPIGRPFATGVLSLTIALALAGLLTDRSAPAPSDLAILATVAATAAATTSLVAGLITLSRFPVSHQRVVVETGAILVLIGIGWVLPATIAPLLTDAFRSPLQALVLGTAAGVVVATTGIVTGPEIDAVLTRWRRLGLLGLVVAAVAGTTLAVLSTTAQVDAVAAIVEIAAGVAAGIAAAALLIIGYRRESTLVAFVGLNVLGLQLFQSLAGGASADDPWRLGASMLALVAAVIGLAGALADYQHFAAQQQSRAFRSWIEAQVAVRRHADLVAIEQERFHDLRAGLVGIEAFLRSAGDRITDRAVLAELERLRAITTDPSTTPQRFDLAASVRALVATREPGRVTVDAPDHLPVIARRADLLEAVANLVDNALRHGSGAPVQVRLSGGDPTVELQVADEGPGIAPDDLPRLFDRGFTTRPDGSGLGLYIVDTVVRSHGGTVEVRLLDPGVEFVARLDIGVRESADREVQHA